MKAWLERVEGGWRVDAAVALDVAGSVEKQKPHGRRGLVKESRKGQQTANSTATRRLSKRSGHGEAPATYTGRIVAAVKTSDAL